MSYRALLSIRHRIAGPTCLVAGYSLYDGIFRSPKLNAEAPNSARRTSPASSTIQGPDKANTKINATGKRLTTGESSEKSSDFAEDESWSWQSFSEKFSDIGASITSIEWSEMPTLITDLIVPTWLQVLPEYIRKLQLELDMAAGSLAEDIWIESQDSDIHPEITSTAYVMIGNDLSSEEVAFRKQRQMHTRHALAHYLDIPVKEIELSDIPTIAICGSGGGLRALVAGASSYASTRQDGLFDCAMYTAGVSGSCWLQTLYFSSMGKRNYSSVLKHLKHRLSVHIAFPPAALRLLTSAPTNKFLLSGLIEKAKGDPKAAFGLVDVYGLLLAARLLVPKGELEIDAMDMKISNQRRYINSGLHPMPLYTMIRHEIPTKEIASAIDSIPDELVPEGLKQTVAGNSWFSWWEMSPYNVWCEEIGAGIPTWSLGRKFDGGVSQTRENGLAMPELRISTLLGIWGSAFCATLSHYYKEVRPVIMGLTGLGVLDNVLTGYNDDLIKVHPISPGLIPNYAMGLEGQLPSTCPKTIFTSTHLELMDAGMSNNLPIYPLLRPGRDIDVLIAFDASADIKQENWLSVADGYAKQRGIKGWPLGIGWPKAGSPEEQTIQELDRAQASTVDEASQRVAEAKAISNNDLGYCTVWIGSVTERSATDSDQPLVPSPPVGKSWDMSSEPDSGLAVIYFPLLPNPKVPGVDPDKSEFMSTWNFIYTPEEIDRVSALAQANFDEGKEQTRRCVRAVYERKKRLRLAREEEYVKDVWRRRLKGHGDHFR